MIRICTGWLLALTFLSGCDRPDVRLPQFIQDDLVVWTITSQLLWLVDEELSDHPVGDIDLTATCGGGGSVLITGTLHDATANLTVELDRCTLHYEEVEEEPGRAATLNLTGSMTLLYETDDATGFPSNTLHSDALDISGAVTSGGETRQVTDECAVSATLLATDVSMALMGEICGRDATVSMAHVSCGP